MVDFFGNVIIPFEYNEIKEFTDGKVIAIKGKNLGILDEFGCVIAPFVYTCFDEFSNSKLIAKCDNFWGVIDNNGEVIFPFEFNYIKAIGNGKAIASKDRKLGIVDDQGNIITPIDYTQIGDFINGMAVAKNINNDFGILDDLGNIIIPFEYEDIKNFENGKAKAKKDYNWGYVDENGFVVIPFDYLEILKFVEGVAMARKISGWGVIDEKGYVVIPFEYIQILKFVEGAAMARKISGWGVIDEFGKEIITDIFDYNNGLIKGKKFEKWGVETKNGEVVVPFNYDSLNIFEYNDGFLAISNKKFAIFPFKSVIERQYELSIESIADFGIFIQICDMKGLLHISSIKKAGNLISDFKRGDRIKIYIQSVDIFSQRISFSLMPNSINQHDRSKSHLINPKEKITSRSLNKRINQDNYMIGTKYSGRIVNKMPFGLFVEIEDNLSPLLHLSEIMRCKQNINDFNVDDNIEVKILSIDNEKERIVLTFA
jgi:predicted RNA-binding protein with RPS1 domain